MLTMLSGLAVMALVSADPLACQPNDEQPMLPIFHIIGNVTKHTDGSIKLESINDCSGVTYYGGLYHIFHQCCQNHFDHVISKDLIHWQRLPPPIQPVTYKTWDGSVTILPKSEGGPIILYDAQDGKLDTAKMDREEFMSHVHAPRDRPVLGVARLVDIDDKYLLNFSRAANNPVIFDGKPAAFPGQIWKNGDHYNMVMQGDRYQSNDHIFHNWKNMGPMVGHGENGGQWWMHVPNQIDGSPPPPGVANRIVNIGGGDHYLFGNYYAENETFVPWMPNSKPIPGKYTRMMPNTDLPGQDYNVSCTDDDCHKDPTVCQAACDADPRCKAWTLVPNVKCCLKSSVPHLVPRNGMTSGVKDPNGPHPSPSPAKGGQEAHLEHGRGAWFGAEMTHDPDGKVKDRMMMIGWAIPDYHGPAGPGVNVLTRLTGLREVNFDVKTMNLVANPLPELKGLRNGHIASKQDLALSATPMVVPGTAGGAASSADIELSFTGFGSDPSTFGACVLANKDGAGLGISITVTNTTAGYVAAVTTGTCSDTITTSITQETTNTNTTTTSTAPLFDEDTLSVRMTPDRSLVDFFVQGGRIAGTLSWESKTPRAAGDSAVLLWSKTSGIKADVDVYGMGCGWLTPSYTEHPTI